MPVATCNQLRRRAVDTVMHSAHIRAPHLGVVAPQMLVPVHRRCMPRVLYARIVNDAWQERGNVARAHCVAGVFPQQVCQLGLIHVITLLLNQDLTAALLVVVVGVAARLVVHGRVGSRWTSANEIKHAVLGVVQRAVVQRRANGVCIVKHGFRVHADAEHGRHAAQNSVDVYLIVANVLRTGSFWAL